MKRNEWRVLLAALGMAAALGGCAAEDKTNETNQTAAEAETVVAETGIAEAVQETSYQEAETETIAGETTETKPEKPEAAEAADNKMTGSETGYEAVLKLYYQALSEEWNPGLLYENDLSPLLEYAYDGYGPENIGYAIMNVDHDENPELLIGACTLDGHPDETIYAMYTLKDGKAENVFVSRERSRYYMESLLENGEAYGFVLTGSDSAYSSEWISYSWYDYEMHVSQAIRFDDQAENKWMMGYEENGEIVYTEPIDEQLADDIMRSALANSVRPAYTPFSDYTE